MAATPSGAPWMVAILEEQRRRGHDVSAVIAGRDGTLAPILEAAGIPFETFDFNGRTRRPPKDPVNALLSQAYSILSKELTGFAMPSVSIRSLGSCMSRDMAGPR